MASLERLDPAQGYHRDNVALVVHELNGSKQWSSQKFTELLAKLDESRDDEDTVLALRAAVEWQRAGPSQTGRLTSSDILSFSDEDWYWCAVCELYRPVDKMVRRKRLCKKCKASKIATYRSTIRGHIITSINNAKTRARKIQAAIASSKRVGTAEFTITFEEALKKLINQGGRCAYSGMLLRYGGNISWAASLERLDSQKGYTDDNVVWVCSEWNVAEYSAGRRTEPGQGDDEGWTADKFNVLVKALRTKIAVEEALREKEEPTEEKKSSN